MVRIAGLLEIRKVTTDAGRRSTRVLPARVASSAIESGMHSGESEAGHLQVIEFRAQPGIDGVALLTLDRKVRGHVVGSGGLSICILVTGIALDRKPLELSHRFAFMAVRAIKASVTADQGEAIIVFPNTLQDDVPAFNGVAGFAVCTHLAAMDVSVTIGAVRTRVRKDRLSMALGTGNTFVQAAQRIFGLIVIELGNRADGFPSR